MKLLRHYYRFIKKYTSQQVSLDNLSIFFDHLNSFNTRSFYITSSFSSFGNALFTPSQFFDHFIDHFGTSVNISCPGHCDPFSPQTIHNNDLRLPNFHTGILPRTLFNSFKSVRSSHPFASTISYGPNSSFITSNHSSSPLVCGSDSPFLKLISLNTVILGFGTNFSATGFHHCVEDSGHYPLDVYEPDPVIYFYTDFDGVLNSKPFYRYNPALSFFRIERNINSYYYDIIKNHLVRSNVLRFYVIGNSVCWSLDTGRLISELNYLLSRHITIYGHLDDPNLSPFII